MPACLFSSWIAGWPTVDGEVPCGGAGAARTVGGFGLWGLKALLWMVWYERMSVSNWSVPTLPMRILRIR